MTELSVLITSEVDATSVEAVTAVEMLCEGDVEFNLTVSGEVRVVWVTVTVLTLSEDSDLQTTIHVKKEG